jgi:hypothetical protein
LVFVVREEEQESDIEHYDLLQDRGAVVEDVHSDDDDSVGELDFNFNRK